MKKLATIIWSEYRLESILLFLGLVLAWVLIYFTFPKTLAPSDTIQTITLVVLVIVTVSYAVSTRKIHKVAVNAEMNAVFPIVNLTIDVISQDQIRVSYQNIGRGPALNLRIWLERECAEQFDYLKSDAMKNKGFVAALGVSQNRQLEWDGSEGELPTRKDGFDVVAEYSDVFQQGFTSKLQIINSCDQEFSFGKKG